MLDNVPKSVTQWPGITCCPSSCKPGMSVGHAYPCAMPDRTFLAAAYERRVQDMREDGRRILEACVARGLCPIPQDPERIVNSIWVTYHPSQYVLLVEHAGWPPDHYENWMRDTVMALFPQTHH